MAEIAVARTPKPATRPATSKELQLDSTLSELSLNIPALTPAQPTIEQQLSALKSKLEPERRIAIDSSLAELTKFQLLVAKHGHFFSAVEFATCSRSIEKTNSELEQALAKGDATRYLAALDQVKGYFEQLVKFINYETTQGLVGTCSDSGVRIYFNDDKVWLCSPDADAFEGLDIGQRKKLADFVQGLTGVKVDFNSAQFQQQTAQGNKQLLGCRIDCLKLTKLPPGGKYQVKTKIRSDGPRNDYQFNTISFSWADLQQGKIPGVIEQTNSLPTIITGEKLDPSKPPQSSSKGVSSSLVTPLAIAPRVVSRPPVASMAATTSGLGSGGSKPAVLPLQGKQATTLQLRGITRQSINSSLSNLNNADKIGLSLAELESSQQGFEQAIRSQEKLLLKELDKAQGNSPTYRQVATALADLERDGAGDVLLRKDLLQRQITVADETGKYGAKAKLVAIAGEVDQAYDKLLKDQALNTDARSDLIAKRAEFKAQAAAFQKEIRSRVGSFVRKIGQRVAVIGQPRFGSAHLEAARMYLAKANDARIVAQAAEVVKQISATDPAIKTAAQNAAELKQLERQGSNIKRQIKILDEKVRAGDKSVAENLAKLNEADAKVSARCGELLEFQQQKALTKAERIALKQEITDLKAKLGQAKNAAASTSDLASKLTAVKAASRLGDELLRKEQQLIVRELQTTVKAKEALTKAADDCDLKMKEQQSAGKTAEVAKCSKLKNQLQSEIKKLGVTEEYLQGQSKGIALERSVHSAEATQRVVQLELEDLRKNPTADSARTALLEKAANNSQVRFLKTTGELTAHRQQFKLSWSQRLTSAIHTFEENVLNKLGQSALKNPLKTMTIVGGIAEGLRSMTEASYDDDARHTCLPSLICLLDSNLEDGFFGLPAEFTTKELGGKVVAGTLEFTSGAGDVALIMGTLKAVHYGASKTIGKTKVGAKLGGVLGKAAVGRGLGFVGAGVDGFLTFSDFDSWKDASDGELLVKTGSPIVVGAACGAFFGPPGAVLGALGGAIGELGGAIYAANELDAEMDKDWRKRGVRDSIRQVEHGFFFPEWHPILDLRNRNRNLFSWEQEAVNDLAKPRLLQRMFSSVKDFSRDDLTTMGFRLDAEGGAHNYQRLKTLLEEPKYRWVWNPFKENNREIIWSNESQDLFFNHNELAVILQRINIEEVNTVAAVYHKGPRVSYENQRTKSTIGSIFSSDDNDGGITSSNQLRAYISEAGVFYKAELKKIDAEIANNKLDRKAISGELAEHQWQTLVQKFPQLGQILSNKNSRNLFFSLFKSTSSIDLQQSEFWTDKVLCPTGQAFCRAVMPEELKQIPKRALSEPLQSVSKLADDLLK